MKQYLIALVLMLTLSTSVMGAGQKHRPHARKTQVVKQDSVKTGITAVSDTTATPTDSAAVALSNSQANNMPPQAPWEDHNDSEFWQFMHSGPGGIGGILIAIVALIVSLGICAIPFIAIIALIKYLIKRNDNRKEIMEKAIEKGQPLPETVKSVDKQSDEYLWKRGIRNAAIGLGLMIMFGFWGAMPLVGIGGLVLCFGLGQAGTAWYSTRKKKENHVNDELNDII